MRSCETQENIIKKALKNNEESLKKIAEAEIYYESDRNDFCEMLDSANEDAAIAAYWAMDTAARDNIMEILD